MTFGVLISFGEVAGYPAKGALAGELGVFVLEEALKLFDQERVIFVSVFS